MSTIFSKRLNSANEKTIDKKDSFDRFGDDLSEVLLSYLSFEDKMRFECLSKQIQSIIFNKVKTINVENRRLSSLILPSHYKKWVFIRSLRAILKKCPNVRKVFFADAVNGEQVFKTLISCCTQLHQIESNFEGLSDKTIDIFCHKFGSRLKKINYIQNNPIIRKVLKLCPNIETIGYDWICLKEIFDGDTVLVKRLKVFAFYYFAGDLKRINTFVEQNKNSLESIEIIIYDKTLTPKHMKTLFKELLKLRHLTTLGIYYYVSTENNFIDFMENLSEKCPKLSKIDFDLRISKSEDIIKVFESLNRLKQLKSIKMTNHLEDFPLIPISSVSLKDCTQLYELTIRGNTFALNDQFFESIEKHLPKLRSIHSNNVDISGQAFKSLSQLPNLRTLSLISMASETVIEDDVWNLIGKSQKIRSIYFINSQMSCDFIDSDIEDIKDIKDLTITGDLMWEDDDVFEDNDSQSSSDDKKTEL